MKTAQTRKMMAPSAQKSGNLTPSDTKPAPGISCSVKIRKTTFFVNQNTTHLWYGA